MITASIIPKTERLTFYPSITKQFRFLKKMIHHFSEKRVNEYHRKGGRYWQFVTLNNGGLFAYPVMDAPVALYHPRNGFLGVFSQEAAGICIWLIALKACSMIAFERGQFVEMGNFDYYQSQLIEYASSHSEWDNIARAIY